MSDTQKQSVWSAVASERAVIGAILGGELDVRDVDLDQEDFTDLICSDIFKVMGALTAQDKPCDMVSISDAMPELDPGILIELLQAKMVSVVQAQKYVSSIKSATMRRALSKTAQNLANLAANASLDPIQSADKIRMEIDELSKNGPAQESVSVASLILQMHDWLFADNPVEDCIKTGISSLDHILGGGIRGSKLFVIGARPSVGKSALGLFFASNAALSGKRVLIVSLEMDEREIFNRVLSRAAQVSGEAIEQRKFTDEETEKVIEAYGAITPMKLMINTKANTPAQIRAEALRLRQNGGIDLIVVDYLQLLSSGQKSSNRTEEVGSISRQLKLITMELKIPVIAMTQMNRQSEVGTGEGGRMPKISESRESGSIEQDANQFLILHQPTRDTLQDEKKQLFDVCKAKHWLLMQIAVAKNRGGRKGLVHVAFDPSVMTFRAFTNQQEG